MRSGNLYIVAAALVAVLACAPAKATPEKSPEADRADKSDKPAEKPAQTSFKVKDKVDVQWNKQWWKGIVLEVVNADTYKVHYVGFSDKNDEEVTKDRVRARTDKSIHGAFDDGAE